MTHQFQLNCSADYRNDGWGVHGSGVTRAWQCFSSTDDTKYCSSPGNRCTVTVSFPLDVSAIPAGAAIQSVTITLRTATGAGVCPSNQTPQITVSVSALDNTSAATVRTFSPITSTPTTYTIATYKRDPLGFPWDIHRINQLLCTITCPQGVADLVRAYEFFAIINYKDAPVDAVTAPSGTVQTASPTIAWTYTQDEGDPLGSTDYRIFTASQVNTVGFSPDSATPVFDQTLIGDVRSVLLPTSLDKDTYWVFVRSFSTFQAFSPWAGSQFTVSAPVPSTPGTIDTTAVNGGTGVISIVPDVSSGSASLTIGDTSNLLSIQEADAEQILDGIDFFTSNATISRDTSTFFPGGGGASWKLLATGSGNMTASTNWVEISAGLPMTVRVQAQPATTARSFVVWMSFYDAGYNFISNTFGSAATYTDATGTWTEAVSGTGGVVPPANSAYAIVSVSFLSCGAGEVHNFDHVGMSYGNNVPWSDGGHMSRNILPYDSPQYGWTPGGATSVSTAANFGVGQSGSALVNSMTYIGVTPTLGFRAAGTIFTTPTAGNDYTLNKPTGTIQGDLMVAFVACDISTTCSPPVGWSLVTTAEVDDGTTDIALFVLKRTAGSAEPTTWTDGTVGDATSVRRWAVVATYSGAADASLQFIGQTGVASPNNNPLFLTSNSITNNASNAWRISAFAVSDNVTGGALVANTQAPSTVPAIAYVGIANVYQSTSSSMTFSINKPSGVISGDLMIAYCSVNGDVTFTAPSGWTLVSQVDVTASGNPLSNAIFMRTAGSSEPNSWSGSFSGNYYQLAQTQCVAYRNAALASSQFIAQAMTSAQNGSSLNTPSVTNTNSSAWRICMFGAFGPNARHGSVSWSSNENTNRTQDQLSDSYSIISAMYDSNGPVGTGSYSRSGTISESVWGEAAWIGIIKPLSSPPASVPNETVRATSTNGTVNPWITAGVFDSAGVAPTGLQSVTGIFTPGSGTDLNAIAAWCGTVIPASPSVAGYAAATMSTPVDVSKIDPTIPDLTGNQVTVTTAFIGTTTGTPYLSVNFYRANVLIATDIAAGSSFSTSTWMKSYATFDLPDGTTRMSVSVAVAGRAVSDIVYWDRISLSFGASPVWRSGTSRPAHPIFATAEVQYADDPGTGYGDWTPVPGLLSQPLQYDPLTGLTGFTDQTLVPLSNRKYRARTLSHGLLGDLFTSPWSPDSLEVSFQPPPGSTWWLKSLSRPDLNMQLTVKLDQITTADTNTSQSYQPLGRSRPIVLTEGYKGEVMTLTFTPVLHTDWLNLKELLMLPDPLFLQSDSDSAWWVRPSSDITGNILPTYFRQSNPMREVTVTFTEVDPPE